VAARTYWLATEHNIGLATTVLGIVGAVVYAVRNRLRPEAAAVYPLLAFGAFFVYALYSGARPLHVKEVTGDLYNVRFGLIMLLAAAVFAGYLVGLVPGMMRRVPWPVVARFGTGAVAVGVLASAAAVSGVVTLDEARDFRGKEAPNTAAAAWLRQHHDGGRTLMMSFGNESVTFDSRIPTQRIVSEGSYKLWQPALRDPASSHIEWIYIRAVPGREDTVWRELYGTPQLEQPYQLVYSGDQRLIYRLRGGRP
jgi:hypothetical protein